MLNNLCLCDCMLVERRRGTWIGQLNLIPLSHPIFHSFFVSTRSFGSLEVRVAPSVNHPLWDTPLILTVETSAPWWLTAPVMPPPMQLLHSIAESTSMSTMTLSLPPYLHGSFHLPSMKVGAFDDVIFQSKRRWYWWEPSSILLPNNITTTAKR